MGKERASARTTGMSDSLTRVIAVLGRQKHNISSPAQITTSWGLREKNPYYDKLKGDLKGLLTGASYKGFAVTPTGASVLLKFSMPSLGKLRVFKCRIPYTEFQFMEHGRIIVKFIHSLFQEAGIMKNSYDMASPLSNAALCGKTAGAHMHSISHHDMHFNAVAALEEIGFLDEVMKGIQDPGHVSKVHVKKTAYETSTTIKKIRPYIQILLKNSVSKEEILELLDEEIVRSIQEL